MTTHHMTTQDMNRKTAFITGAASGIGAACAMLLAGRGCRVILADRDAAALPAIRAGLPPAPQPMALPLDVADTDALRAAFTRLAGEGVVPDILVNSAGIREIKAPLDLEPEDWDRVMQVNLRGTFFACQSFARGLRAAGRPGVIVNIASTAAILASRSRTAYAASKHGVAGLTKQLAYELGEAGIRVNAVAPGVIRTPMTEAYFEDPANIERLARAYPLGGAGMPGDIAEVVAFLASDAARFVTGAVIPVDGGYTVGKTW